MASDILARASAAVERTASIAVDPTSEDPIVLAGGLLFEGSPIMDHLANTFGARCVRVESGLAGAALLALRHLEFKKTFMDEWTGVADPMRLKEIAQALTRTIEPVEAALAAMPPIAASQESPDDIAS